MAKRPRFSRWRRLPGVFRSGDRRPADAGTELDRIILYVPARILDLAEALAEKLGAGSVQEYCALILMKGLEIERVQQRVAEFETRRGPLEGLKEIANDPDYLAEWQRRSDMRTDTTAQGTATDAALEVGQLNAAAAGEPMTVDVVLADREPRALDPPPEFVAPLDGGEPGLAPAETNRSAEQSSPTVPKSTLKPVVRLMSEGSPREIIARHVGANEDERGFLPCLRRGEPVSVIKAAELCRALEQLEDELRGAEVIDRATAHALHRLALESQVMLTDAWPGFFDERVIMNIRKVQESVERILSGQDIRYYPAPEEAGQEQQH